MSPDLQELKKELQRLIKQREIDAEALRRAQVRASGRRPDSSSNRAFAASEAEGLKKLERRIAEIEAEIERAEGGGQES
jgi:hypothetical protein